MALFSTLIYDKATQAKSRTPLTIASVVFALAVGVGLGYLISSIDSSPITTESNGTAAISHEQFLRINTEDLDHLAPMVAPLAPVVAPEAVDPWIVRNVDSYGWLKEAPSTTAAVDTHFVDINTATDWAVSLPALNACADVVCGSEPFGQPNYGRLETYLGSEPVGGVR